MAAAKWDVLERLNPKTKSFYCGEWRVLFWLYTTVEPRFNEPLYYEVLGLTNDIFQPSNSVMYGKEPWYNEPSI